MKEVQELAAAAEEWGELEVGLLVQIQVAAAAAVDCLAMGVLVLAMAAAAAADFLGMEGRRQILMPERPEGEEAVGHLPLAAMDNKVLSIPWTTSEPEEMEEEMMQVLL
jgi:hypothetical protein